MTVLVLFLALTLVSVGLAERSHWGNEFVIPFLSNFETKGFVKIYMMTKEETSVHVEIPWENRQESLNIASSSRGTISLPWNIRYSEDLTAVQKAVYINSSQPIAVYTFSYVSNSASSFLAIPVDVLGDHYLAASYTRKAHDTSVVVAAVEDNTVVTFHYKVNSGSCGSAAHKTGTTSTHLIHRLNVIGVQCNQDLTGTIVTSNRPVSVVSGNIGGKIPISKGGTDVFEEMLIPVKDFGKEYVLTNAGRSVGSVNRLIASEDDTEVSTSTGNVFNLMKSDFTDIDTEVDGEQCIQSNKPILTVAFGKGLKANSDNVGDPLMIIIPPVSRFQYDYALEFNISTHVSGYTGFTYLTVVGESDDIPDLEAELAAVHTSLANCNYSVIHKEVKKWPLQLPKSNTTRFSGVVYGLSNYMGLGMPLGMVLVPQYCWSSTCENNGTCEEVNDSFVCHCDVEYTGNRCQHARITSTETDKSSTQVLELSTDVWTRTLSVEIPETSRQTTESTTPETTLIQYSSSALTAANELFSSDTSIIYEQSLGHLTTFIYPTLPPLVTESTESALLSPAFTTAYTGGNGPWDPSTIYPSSSDTGISSHSTSSPLLIETTVTDSGSRSTNIARVTLEVCTCLCKGSRLDVLEVHAVKEATDKIQSELLLETQSLSKTVRKYTSAPDERKSAKNIGAVGITLLVFTLGVMAISDVLSVLRAVLRYFKRRYQTQPK